MYSNSSNLTAKKTGFAQDKLVEFDTATTVTSIDGTQTDFATASFFGRLTYAYDNRYLFETNLRYDGSSRFARKSRWGLFPSVSAGWRISQEAFMQDSGIDNLKLRASWGKLGNHAIGNYEYQATYASGYLYSVRRQAVAGHRGLALEQPAGVGNHHVDQRRSGAGRAAQPPQLRNGLL